MQSYTLYNDDVACAQFIFANGLIREYHPTLPALLPMQIRSGGAESFTLWLNMRSIDLNVLQHRNMVNQLLGHPGQADSRAADAHVQPLRYVYLFPRGYIHFPGCALFA